MMPTPSDLRIIDIQVEIARRKTTAVEHTEKGNGLFDKGDYGLAMEEYNVALKAVPNHMEALGNRANVKSAMKDWSGCISDCDKVLNLSLKRKGGGAVGKSDLFNEAVVYYTRAEAYYHMQKYYDCLADCDSSLQLHPRFTEALCCRGAAHNALGSFKLAKADLDIAVKMRPKYGVARRHRGIAEYMKGEYAEAVRDLREAVALEPDDSVRKWLKKSEEALLREDKEALRRGEELCRGEEEKESGDCWGGGEKGGGGKRGESLPAPTPPSFASFILPESNLNPPSVPSWETESISSAATSGVAKSLEHDLFCIEVAAIVDTVIAMGTASVMGTMHKVSEQMCFAVALQMQSQTKIGLMRALHEQYISENLRNIFQQIQVEALVDTAIAVGTASVLGKLRGGGKGSEVVSEQMVINAAMQMENQVKYGLIRMKEQYIADNVRHVFENVNESEQSTGRRFSWSHHCRLGRRSSREHSLKELETMRKQFEEAERDL